MSMSSGPTLVSEKSALADALEPAMYRKDRPPPFSDLIVVNQGDKYMVPPPEPNRDQEKNVVVRESSVERRHRQGMTLKLALLIGLIILIVLVAVMGAIAGTVWRKHKDPPSQSPNRPPSSVVSTGSSGTVHNMSGTATATAGYIYPTAVAPEPTIIHVFSVGGNASMYVRTQNTDLDPLNANGNWSSLGGTITPGVVAAVSRGAGSVNAFSRGTSSELYHKYLTNGSVWGPSTWDWDDRKGNMQNAPEVISWGENRLDVFTIGDGNGLSTLTWNSTNMADWGNWLPLGGQWSKQIMPSLVSWAKGRLDVFLVHPKSNMLYHRFLDPNATNWQPFYGFESLGGQIAGRPSALSLGFGKIDVFARGKDAGLWHMSLDSNGTWGDWIWRGDNIRGEPAVVSCGRNRIDVFVWGEDFKYYYKSFDGTKWIPDDGFTSLGDALFGGPPKVLSRTEGMIDLFGYSNHGAVMHKAWSKEDGGWAPNKPFENWGTPGS